MYGTRSGTFLFDRSKYIIYKNNINEILPGDSHQGFYKAADVRVTHSCVIIMHVIAYVRVHNVHADITYLRELPVPTCVALAVTLFVDQTTGTGNSGYG